MKSSVLQTCDYLHPQVSVSKGGAALIFECESDGELLSITHIAHEPSRPAPRDGEDEDEEDDTPDYTGPVFEDLDDTLQQVGASLHPGRKIPPKDTDRKAHEGETRGPLCI